MPGIIIVSSHKQIILSQRSVFFFFTEFYGFIQFVHKFYITGCGGHRVNNFQGCAIPMCINWTHV